jgi:hypothetical protein
MTRDTCHMPYIKRGIERFSRFRLLISGFSNTGKTHSLASFLYGPYDIRNPEQRDAAYEYASTQQKSMVILECPGEVGHRTLLPDNEFMQSYYYQTSPDEDTKDVKWSRSAIQEFNATYTAVTNSNIDILVLDGAHGLHKHMMNDITNGDFLNGLDLNLSTTSSSGTDRYRAAGFYNRCHNRFGQFIHMVYSCSIPLVIVTTWEKWEEGKTDNERTSVETPRYLWPDIPGEMARRVVGYFDARVSSRLDTRCYRGERGTIVCEDDKQGNLHHLWQFYPKNEVQGVGIKGVRMTERMKERPWLHQHWDDLHDLILSHGN